MLSHDSFFSASWQAPQNVRTIITTRIGGCSVHPYDCFNLATHVGDNIDHVQQNRQLLLDILPSNANWLCQTHSSRCLHLTKDILNDQVYQYDASFTSVPNTVCTVMSADCVPILLTNEYADTVAAIHAGWRGIADSIVEKTVLQAFKVKSAIIAYIGPAICKNHFEVGEEVRQQFISLDDKNQQFFHYNSNKKFNCDLNSLVVTKLHMLGVKEKNIYLSNLCTYCLSNKFYSFRRDSTTGRMASMIWLKSN